MSMSSFKAAICEMTSVDDVSVNLQQIHQILDQTKSQSVDFVSFPENALYFRVDMDHGEKYALQKEDPAFLELAERAKEDEILIHLGSVPIWHEGKIHNCTVIIREEGVCEFLYSKMHLFDIYLEGKKPILESDYYDFGWAPQVFEWKGFKFGLSICYDLRFSELFNYYAREEVDVLLIPAAFLPKTGEAHWEVLLRARAIECQAYVFASAQGGEHFSTQKEYSRKTYGHSLVVEPWGQVLEHDGAKTVFVEVEREKIQSMRQQIPMKDHRRFNTNWTWTK